MGAKQKRQLRRARVERDHWKTAAEGIVDHHRELREVIAILGIPPDMIGPIARGEFRVDPAISSKRLKAWYQGSNAALWRVEQTDGGTPDSQAGPGEPPSYGVCDQGGEFIADSLTHGDANRIALCLNCHDGLLAACKALLPHVEGIVNRGQSPGEDTSHFSDARACAKARAAIAEAERK